MNQERIETTVFPPAKAAISTTRQVDRQQKLNVNGMEFVSIQDEEYREYDFGEKTYRIEKPQWLFVRPSKAHQVIDANGVTHYVQANFMALRWKNAPNAERAQF